MAVFVTSDEITTAQSGSINLRIYVVYYYYSSITSKIFFRGGVRSWHSVLSANRGRVGCWHIILLQLLLLAFVLLLYYYCVLFSNFLFLENVKIRNHKINAFCFAILKI